MREGRRENLIENAMLWAAGLAFFETSEKHRECPLKDVRLRHLSTTLNFPFGCGTPEDVDFPAI